MMKHITHYTKMALALFFMTFLGHPVVAQDKDEVVEVSTIAELRAQELTNDSGNTYLLTGEAILIYQQSNRNQKFIQDETAGILIDDNSGTITTQYSIGDGITGIWGNLSSFNNNLQFVPLEDPGEASSLDNPIVGVERTLEELSWDDQGRLVKILNVSFDDTHHGSTFTTNTNFTVEDASGTMTLRTSFHQADYIGGPIPTEEMAELYAIVGMHHDNVQIIPRSLADMGVTEMHSVAALRAQPVDGTTVYTLNTEVVLTYQQSFRNQKYIQDDTAGIMIDDSDGVITSEYSVYDGITGISGTLGVFGNMLQFVPAEDPGEATSEENEVIPVIIDMEEYTQNFMKYQSRLVTLEYIEFLPPSDDSEKEDFVFANGQVYDFTDGELEAKFRATFFGVDYIGSAVPLTPVNITGLPNSRSDGDYITARNWADIASTEFYSVTFTIVDENENVIEDALLTFMGETIDQAPYVVDGLALGSYSWSISKAGFHTRNGSVAISGEDVELTVMLIALDDHLVDAFPWTEGFEDSFLPVGWSKHEMGAGEWQESPVANTGDAAAFHNFTSEEAESWMITPQIQIVEEEEGSMILSFFERNARHGFYENGKSSVWVSLGSGNPANGEFFEVYESLNQLDNYTERVISLADYAGEVIYVAFKYEGADAHLWYVDDVTVDFAPEAIEVNDLATLRSYEPGTDLIFYLTTEVVITHMHEWRNQKYLQDETAAIVLDDNAGIIETSYELYDGVTGIKGTLTHFNNLLQFVPVENTEAATSQDNVVEPLEITLAELAPEHQAQLIVVRMVEFDTEEEVFIANNSFTITDPSGTGVLRTPNAATNLDYFNTAIPNYPIKMTALVGQFGDDMQIFPRSSADMVEDEDDNGGDNGDDETIVEDVKSLSARAYPVPFQNTLHVNNLPFAQYTISIVNVMGQIVLSTNVEADGFTMNTSDLENGLYFVRIENEHGAQQVIRVIKR